MSYGGGDEGTAEESPPVGRLTDETDYFRLADHTEVTTCREELILRELGP